MICLLIISRFSRIFLSSKCINMLRNAQIEIDLRLSKTEVKHRFLSPKDGRLALGIPSRRLSSLHYISTPTKLQSKTFA